MNKNWLYRILAIALVAMLALPVFAMAEEVEEFDLGEIVLEEKPLTDDDGDGEADPFPWGEPWDFNNPSTTFEETIDLGNAAWISQQFLYTGAISTFKKTNSNSKVVTVSQRGTVSLTGKTGKSTITFKAKQSQAPYDYHTVTIKLTIKNTAKLVLADGAKAFPSSAAAYIADEDDHTYIGKYVVDGEDTDPDQGNYYVTYKSNNKKVADVNFATGALTVGKKGTATITVRLYNEPIVGERPMLVASLTKKITVKANEYKDTKVDEEACLKAAKDDKDIYVGVRSAKYTKVDTEEGTGDLKVVFFVCNGTKNPIKEIFGLSEAGVTVKKYETAKDKRLNSDKFEELMAEQTTELLAEGKAKTVNWKANGKKVGTIEATFKGVPLVNLTGDLTQVEATSFSYKLTKKDLEPTEIVIKDR